MKPEWPKKMYAIESMVGEWYAVSRALPGISEGGALPVLVYKAEDAPQPVAWRYSTHFVGAMPVYAYASVESESSEPLYTSPPTEAAIRQSEREKVADWLQTQGIVGMWRNLCVDLAARIRRGEMT